MLIQMHITIECDKDLGCKVAKPETGVRELMTSFHSDLGVSTIPDPKMSLGKARQPLVTRKSRPASNLKQLSCVFCNIGMGLQTCTTTLARASTLDEIANILYTFSHK